MVNALAKQLRAQDIAVHLAGPLGSLPWLADGHPATDAIAQLIPAYRLIEQDSMHPRLQSGSLPGLSKTTVTF